MILRRQNAAIIAAPKHRNGSATWQVLMAAMAAHDTIKAVVLVVSCPTLLGCISLDEVRVASGVFEIATPANGSINSEGRARVILDLRAGELCPNGYDRLRASRIVDTKGVEIMRWRVACRL